MKVIGTILTCVVIFACGLKCNDQSDRLHALQIENAFLKDYKRCYFDHLDKCDSLHKNCFKIK